MSARSDLATAATVAGVSNVSERYRQSLKPGDGFVKRGQRRRADNGFGFIDTWEVWLALPSDLATAEKWLDDHLDTLSDAISNAMVVKTVTPNELGLTDAVVNGVIFAGVIPT